jgi:hypothetical protein
MRPVGGGAAGLGRVGAGSGGVIGVGLLRAESAGGRSRSAIAGGRALMAVKSRNWPRLALSPALQMGDAGIPATPGSRDRAMLLFKFCAVCDRAFAPTRRDAKFCSSACRQACYRCRKATKATEAKRRADWAAALMGVIRRFVQRAGNPPRSWAACRLIGTPYAQGLSSISTL